MGLMYTTVKLLEVPAEKESVANVDLESSLSAHARSKP
jgi:hypothetical protein